MIKSRIKADEINILRKVGRAFQGPSNQILIQEELLFLLSGQKIQRFFLKTLSNIDKTTSTVLVIFSSKCC